MMEISYGLKGGGGDGSSSADEKWKLKGGGDIGFSHVPQGKARTLKHFSTC
jgi:hypothetical protein